LLVNWLTSDAPAGPYDACMDAGRSDSRSFATALIATTLVVVGFVAWARWSTPVRQASGVEVTEPRIDVSPAADASSLPVKPAVIATVYECDEARQKVFSDRPCSEDVRIREVIAPNGMRATDVTRYARVGSRSEQVAASAGSAEPPARSKISLCKSIDDQIDRINARMRQTYTAAEGEWYREHLRRLDDDRWDAKCRIH
jgi:hypothetical protein